MKICNIDDCDRKHCARGLCNKHYQKLRKATIAEGEAWAKQLKLHPRDRYTENPDTECWDWQGAVHYTGYGQVDSRTYGTSMAHRFIYELHRGPIPEGLTLDHLCRNTTCVNPAHLEPVTAAENTRRMQRFKKSGLAPGGRPALDDWKDLATEPLVA